MDPMTAAILGAVAALPDLIKLGGEFMTWLNSASGGDPKGYVKKLGDSMAKLNSAQTDAERQEAAHEIAKSIAGL